MSAFNKSQRRDILETMRLIGSLLLFIKRRNSISKFKCIFFSLSSCFRYDRLASALQWLPSLGRAALEEKGSHPRVCVRGRQSFGSSNRGSHRIHIAVLTLSRARKWNLRTQNPADHTGLQPLPSSPSTSAWAGEAQAFSARVCFSLCVTNKQRSASESPFKKLL